MLSVRVSTLVGATLLAALVVASPIVRADEVEGDKFLADLRALAEAPASGKLFTEDTVGHDLHGDEFYYDDSKVRKAFDRKSLKKSLTVLAGQAPDITGKQVSPAKNPFVVGHRSLNPWGSSLTRFDVKDNGGHGQFLALYSGSGGEFVVNKLRAHLLRRLANVVQDQLPLLDRTGEEDASAHPEAVDQVRSELVDTIKGLFREVNAGIRETMRDGQETRASATVAIVSEAHIITANVGEGRVIAYNSEFQTLQLTPVHSYDPNYGKPALFGDMKVNPEAFDVDVQIHPRYTLDSNGEVQNVQLLLLETPDVAATLDDGEAFKMVLNNVQTLKNDPEHEQEIYSSSANAILNAVDSRIKNPLSRMYFKQDHAVILVGLDTDYNNIH